METTHKEIQMKRSKPNKITPILISLKNEVFTDVEKNKIKRFFSSYVNSLISVKNEKQNQISMFFLNL